MDRRPRADRRASAAACAVFAGVAGIWPAVAQAQASAPAAVAAPSDAELERAKDRYQAGETAMADQRFADAAYDYAAAYELSRDPALLFKLGRAHERDGQCDVALGFYARYLREGQPTEAFARATRERIAACDGKRGAASATAGSGAAADATSVPAKTRPNDSAGTTITPGPAAGSSATGSSATGSSATGSSPAGSSSTGSSSTGSPDATGATTTTTTGATAGAALPRLSNQRRAAWLITGGAVAMVALGGVLAYAASSSENDVRDLYIGFARTPPSFDRATRKSYDDLIAQGHQYQHLAWAAFGTAGAAAIGAALLFWLDERPAAREAPRIAPAVGPHGAGVSVRF
ncbi:MAG TPA: hypothetical protein VGC42_03790 [Kofleriaceae bacterium]